MSATFEIYDDQNEEKSCEYPDSLLPLKDKPKIIPLEEREIPMGIPFVKEAKLETLEEIKDREQRGYFSFNGECKEQECYRGEEGGSPARKDIWLGQECYDSDHSPKSEYPYQLSTPKLIQTSCLSENEVDVVLGHLLDLIYMSPNDQAYNWENNFAEKPGFTEPDQERLSHLMTQMSLRLQEGQGEAKYIVGVGNNCTFVGLSKEEMLSSLKTLCQTAAGLKADILLLDVQEGSQGKVVQVLIRSTCRDKITPDIKVMLLGDTQSGKSTLAGLLAFTQTDDGNGSLRENMHTHRHEIISGETSSLNFHIIAFENNGNTQNYKNCEETEWQKTVESGAKIFTFIDIGGHEKHKQKVYSTLTSVYPDYILLVVSAAQGVTATTEHHLKLALLSEIPIVIVITHRDLITENQLYELKLKIESSIKRFSDEHYLVVAENNEDNLILSRTIKQKIVIPVFTISSVNRNNVNLFKSFLALLPVNNILTSNIDLPSEFHAYSTLVKGSQIILTGIVLKGFIKKHQILLFGPDAKGNFKHVEVANIRNKGVLVRQACAGQICTVEIKVGKFTQQWLESEQEKTIKGMILIDPKTKPQLTTEFVAEISLLEDQASPVTFYEEYEPVIMTQSIKQACHLDFETLELQEISEQNLYVAEKENCGPSNNMDYSFAPRSFMKKKSAKKFGKGKDSHVSSNNTKVLESSAESKPSKNVSKPKETNTQSKNKQNALVRTDKQKSNIRKISPEDFGQKKKKEGRFVVIQPGETKTLTFRFKFHAEYLVAGQKVIIDDTCVKCVGTVKRVLHTSLTTRT